MERDLRPLLVDGVLLRREALEWGLDDDDLTMAVRHHALVRIRQGAYADAAHWRGLSERARLLLLKVAVVRLYEGDVVISHDSAVVMHGGPDWGLDLRRLHVTRPGAKQRTQARIVHHDAPRNISDVALPQGGFVTSPARTVVETTIRLGSVEKGVVMASDFLHRGITTLRELSTARAAAESTRGSLIVRPVIALADGRLESVAESRVWYMFHRYELHGVIPQYPVHIGGRLYASLDFAIPELGIWIEVDGVEKYVKHLRAGESVADMILRERRRELRSREETGLEPLRLIWDDIDHPDQTMERIWRFARRRAA